MEKKQIHEAVTGLSMKQLIEQPSLQEQLSEQRARYIEQYSKQYAELQKKLEQLGNEHRDMMHWYDEFPYELPQLIEACSKVRLEIVTISGNGKKIHVNCRPKGFKKMDYQHFTVAHERRRKQRAIKIQNVISEKYKCKSVYCNEYSLEGDGYIIIEIWK